MDALHTKALTWRRHAIKAEAMAARLSRPVSIESEVEDVVTGWDESNHLTHAPGRLFYRLSIRVPMFIGYPMSLLFARFR